MAKKSRRARRKKQERPVQTTGTPPPSVQGAVRAQPRKPETLSGSEFSQEYAYVYSDLKRIAILAGTFLSILVLLSFLID